MFFSKYSVSFSKYIKQVRFYFQDLKLIIKKNNVFSKFNISYYTQKWLNYDNKLN